MIDLQASKTYEEVKELKSSATTKAKLKGATKAIEVQTKALKKMKVDLVKVAGKYVSDVAISGYCDIAELKDEIKDMVNKALVTNSSTAIATSNFRVLATKADFKALDNFYLRSINQACNDLVGEGNKLRADLKSSFASMKFNYDLHINKMRLSTEDIIENMTKAAN